MLRRAALGATLCFLLVPCSGALAATLAPGFDDAQVTSVPQPTALAFTPDGHLLVTTKTGQLRVIHDDALLSAPAVDLSGRICPQSERGLLGVAVDPDFQSNHQR